MARKRNLNIAEKEVLDLHAEFFGLERKFLESDRRFRKRIKNTIIGIPRKNKIPKWWYSGFKKNFFCGCKTFIRCWYASEANPLWEIKRKLKRWWR